MGMFVVPHHHHVPQFWQHHQEVVSPNLGPTAGGGGGDSAAAGSTATCQDCGNQAKKDCTHRRCRTCCKSRGFECATHVKSTWVPAARRRERQLVHVSGVGGGPNNSSGSTSGAKKPRLVNPNNTSNSNNTSNTSNTNTTPPRSFDTTSSHHHHHHHHQEVGGAKEGLPGQIRAAAVFKCVRVTAVEDGGDDEYAYQAVVKIGGHIFKGFLYDQGLTPNNESFPNISELRINNNNNGGNGASSSPIIDPSADVFLSSTYGNHPIN